MIKFKPILETLLKMHKSNLSTPVITNPKYLHVTKFVKFSIICLKISFFISSFTIFEIFLFSPFDLLILFYLQFSFNAKKIQQYEMSQSNSQTTLNANVTQLILTEKFRMEKLLLKRVIFMFELNEERNWKSNEPSSIFKVEKFLMVWKVLRRIFWCVWFEVWSSNQISRETQNF